MFSCARMLIHVLYWSRNYRIPCTSEIPIQQGCCIQWFIFCCCSCCYGSKAQLQAILRPQHLKFSCIFWVFYTTRLLHPSMIIFMGSNRSDMCLIAALPNVIYLRNSYTTRLLQSSDVGFFMLVNRTYMGMGNRYITEFLVFFGIRTRRGYNIQCFFLFSCAWSAHTDRGYTDYTFYIITVIQIVALPNFM